MGYNYFFIKYELEIEMDDFIIEEIRDRLLKCIKVYGLEGMEDKIKDIYSQMPTLREAFLTEYYKLIRGK